MGIVNDLASHLVAASDLVLGVLPPDSDFDCADVSEVLTVEWLSSVDMSIAVILAAVPRSEIERHRAVTPYMSGMGSDQFIALECCIGLVSATLQNRG